MARYFVRYRVKATGRENVTDFDSMTMLRMWVIAQTPYVDVLKEWIG